MFFITVQVSLEIEHPDGATLKAKLTGRECFSGIYSVFGPPDLMLKETNVLSTSS